MSDTRALKEVLALLKEIEKQTNNSNKALEVYTRNLNKLNVGGGSTTNNNTNPALSYMTNKGMSALTAYSGKTGAQVANLTKSVSSLTTASAAAVGVVGSVAVGLTAMATAGKKAASTNNKVALGLSQLGKAQTQYTEDAVRASNSMNQLKNSWSNTVLALQQTFTPFLNWLLDCANGLSSLIGANGNVNYAQSIAVKGGIATTARGQGFSQTSSQNLSNGIYNMALQLGTKHGMNPNDIVGSLESSIFSGGAGASQFGLYNDDGLLSGYMLNKGIDSVNTEVTEAMKSYQRFLLLQEQLNGTVGEDAVDSFRKLGTEITKTKNALFSFDEVITLNGYSSAIPEVGPISSIAETEELKSANELLENLTNLTMMGKLFNSMKELASNLNSLKLPEVSNHLESWLNDLYSYLTNLGLEIPVGLFVPEEEKEKLTGSVGTVTVPVTFENLVENFEHILSELQTGLNIDIPLNTDGVVEDLKEMLNSLNTYHPYNLGFNVGVNLADGVKEKIESTLSSWNLSIPISVEGFEGVLSNISNLFNGLTLPQVEGVHNTTTTTNNNFTTYSFDNSANNLLNGLLQHIQILIQKIQGNTDALTGSISYEQKLLGHYETYLNNLNSMSSALNQGQPFLSSITGSSFSANIPTTQTATQTATQATNTSGNASIWDVAKDAYIKGSQKLSNFIGEPSGNTSGIGAGIGLSGISLLPMGLPMFAGGGISTQFTYAGISEGNKAEAIIPLETEQGVEYLAKAMAMANNNYNNSETTLNISIPGNLFINNEAQLNRLAEVIASKIAIQNNRRGSL